MIESLVDQLELVASNLRSSLIASPDRPNFSPLRQLQRYCETRIAPAQDQNERFICFYFSSIIDYIFYNLAGDTPYFQELHQSRVSLAGIILEELESVARALRDNDDKKLLQELASLVNASVDSVVSLNKTHCK